MFIGVLMHTNLFKGEFFEKNKTQKKKKLRIVLED